MSNIQRLYVCFIITTIIFISKSSVVYAGCSVSGVVDPDTCRATNTACLGKNGYTCSGEPSGEVWVVYGSGSCSCTDPLFPYCVTSIWYCCGIGSSPEECGGGPACFLPGTKVQTPKGLVKIEDFKALDKVVSIDPKSGVLTENLVNSLHITSKDHYYTIKTASGKEVKATDEHPFYTGEKSAVQKSFIQKVQATVGILYIYLQDGWQVAKQKAS